MVRKSGVGLVELIVALAITTIGTVVLVEAVKNSGALSRRETCATNLTAITKAIATYASDQSGEWPVIYNDTDKGMVADAPMRVAADSVYDLYTLKTGGPTQLNMVENLNQLVPQAYVQYKTFICPGSGNEEMTRAFGGGAGTNGAYGFMSVDGKVHCDYAYQIGYTKCSVNGGAMADNSTDLTREPDSGLVILADKAPHGRRGIFEAGAYPNRDIKDPSWIFGNHGRDGVNTLAGFSVAWANKVNCGWNNNNIYENDIDASSNPPNSLIPRTLCAAPINKPPTSQYDSFLINPKSFWDDLP